MFTSQDLYACKLGASKSLQVVMRSTRFRLDEPAGQRCCCYSLRAFRG